MKQQDGVVLPMFLKILNTHELQLVLGKDYAALFASATINVSTALAGVNHSNRNSTTCHHHFQIHRRPDGIASAILVAEHRCVSSNRYRLIFKWVLLLLLSKARAVRFGSSVFRCPGTSRAGIRRRTKHCTFSQMVIDWSHHRPHRVLNRMQCWKLHAQHGKTTFRCDARYHHRSWRWFIITERSAKQDDRVHMHIDR